LVYNHAKKACDYPVDPYYTQPPTTTPTTTTSPPTKPTATSSTSNKNPCYGGQNGPYPNPADPHTFFNCDWGNVYLQKCPANLVYNHAKKACDYPVNLYY
uniref:chitinase n=1 Tax=Gasterosteus aculeatus TaxID=69293 RepID=G3PG83_GASAC